MYVCMYVYRERSIQVYMRASFVMLNKCYVLNKSIDVFQFMYAMYQQWRK